MNLLQSGLASAERVFELLDAPEEAPDVKPAATLEEEPARAAGRVKLEHVRFRYEPAKPLIEDFSLEVAPGHTVAIVGPTGAGKTTIVNLLVRFYEIDGGHIHLDGIDYRDLTRDEVRRAFGMVLQDTWLFAGSIRDNIGYGKQGATDKEIVAAAKAAYVDGFVRTLPNGYDTVLDSDTSNFVLRTEAADHHCPRLPRQPEHPHPRRGDEQRRHPDRGADPAGDGVAAAGTDELCHRPPAVHDP